jgi:hypothetical protein
LPEKESRYRTDFKPYDQKIYQKEVCPVLKMPDRPRFEILINVYHRETSPGKKHLNFD